MSRKSVIRITIFALVLGVALLGPAWAYQEVAVTDGGAISGTVKFGSAVPKLEPISVPEDQATCGKSVPSEGLTVNPQNKGLKNAVVFLEKIEKGKKLEAKAAILDNNKCLFVPHVQAVPVGATLDVKNSDPILHNTHSYLGSVTVFNLALPMQGQVIKRKITKPGPMRVQCDAHPHMSAWVVTVEHPYFAVSDENGNFELSGVPPGTYKVVAWHEPWKVKGKDKGGRLLFEPQEGVKLVREVTVSAKGEAKITFEFK